ncbi:hypothetical protein PBAL39_17604 [Pedobacter sp. BAL39]|uniref:DUF5686 and carboxypeptidase-like regulatory domain-containing protein n=1 Tax=Pedobacter sp. BAL39 TaxID=391596 RepID=UPI000155AB67|nr:DUF5686 and carboxypeptidase-like regulatory domain-containing protein [Pedobacter sp. BAL39]EDM33902.1 hypothetical protein PBAL39_17604 [Pedobacter sp. BAL39]
MGFSAVAQQTTVSGIVTDAKTKETLPYVSFQIVGTTKGGRTDADGHYNITLNAGSTQLKFSYVGYTSQTKTVKSGQSQTVNVQLQPEAMLMDEVVISAGKKPKYRNKENPAVALIRKVIENKPKNRMENYDYVSYQKYELMAFSLSNLSDKFKNNRIFRNYQFLFQEQDSTKIGGKNFLPVYQEEKLSDNYYRKNPEKLKTIEVANKRVNFDARFIDTKGMSVYFDRMYQDINIYDNNISVVSNQLLSPIADAAPSFYKFFITDTIKTQQPYLVELAFTPRNNTDLLFEGRLYVTLDGNYAVQNAFLSVNKHINLNFVRALEAKLDFEKNPDSRYHLSKSNLLIDFGLSKNGGKGFTGERTVNFKDYKINQPISDSLFNVKPSINEPAVIPNAESEEFWAKNRPEPLTAAGMKVYTNIDTLQKIPSFTRTMDIITLVGAGFKDFGPFEMGPVNTFYSFNGVEGFRLRLGGRTTTALSKRYYFETYGAYGFKDEKFKFFLSGTYSLNNKSIYAFPQNYIRASFQRDTKIPGQELQFVQEDNFLLSFKRGENNMLLYNDFYRIDYMREFENHFSYSIGLRKWQQTPAGTIYFGGSSLNPLDRINQISTSEVTLSLRYAPHEKFYQGKLYRTPIIDKYPTFNLRYTAGLKDVLGGEYNYHNFMGSIDKRFYLSQLGYTDVTLEGAYIIGKVPFPLLAIHRANQTYAYQLNSYNLMNFLEFVSDRYASVMVDHNFNGFFFNKIPLLKKLKLRECFSVKALYGGLRAENDPSVSSTAMQFVKNEEGQTITHSLNNEPYIEGSVGVGNIFKVLRVDAVKRFTYLDNPGISEWGIRARVKFDF